MDWDTKNYHETCGRVTEHGARLVDELRKLRGGRALNTVLDVGCGTGVLTNDIAGFAREIIGIDASPAMIEKAKELYPCIPFYVMDACSLTWVDYFDAVFSNAVFHFIKTQDALLDSIYTVLKKNGMLICEFGAAGNLAALLDAVSAACIKRGKPYSLRFFYPDRDEYGDMLIKHGFIIESLITYDLDTRLLKGDNKLRDWIKQIFNVEMAWFNAQEIESVFHEIESVLKPVQWDGDCWHLPNRRVRVIASKA